MLTDGLHFRDDYPRPIAAPRLAKIPDGFHAIEAQPGAIRSFARLTEGNLAEATECLDFGTKTSPRRSVNYVLNRYLRHPFYRYEAHLAEGSGNKAALLITRLCHHDGASALRVVDAMAAPDILADCGEALRVLLANSSAEYLDFYSSAHRDALLRAGLDEVGEHPGLVLPCHFEPFERSNIELNYSFLGAEGEIAIFKGDADQDRPSRL